jgi:hypothetical protein
MKIYLQKGIDEGCADCVNIFGTMFIDKSEFYLYLNSLENKSEAVIKK